MTEVNHLDPKVIEKHFEELFNTELRDEFLEHFDSAFEYYKSQIVLVRVHDDDEDEITTGPMDQMLIEMIKMKEVFIKCRNEMWKKKYIYNKIVREQEEQPLPEYEPSESITTSETSS